MTTFLQSVADGIQADPEGVHNLRRARYLAHIARQLRTVFEQRQISLRALAQLMGTSLSQVQRLLSMTHPSNVTLDTLLRAGKALDIEITVEIGPKSVWLSYKDAKASSCRGVWAIRERGEQKTKDVVMVYSAEHFANDVSVGFEYLYLCKHPDDLELQ